MKRGSNRSIRLTLNAPVTLAFAALCLAALLLNVVTAGHSNSMFFITYHSSLKDPLTYLRFFTHVLGHGGWQHFMSNMTYLLLLGPILEEKYGPKVMLQIIVITALVTSITHYILFPKVGLCGASGVVFAFILLASFTSVKSGEIPVTFILVAVIFLGQQIWDGIFKSDDISNLTHILGGVVGSAVGFALAKKKRR
ncbi:MAG: rhomboid family intramembrane serine protease [Acetatifactor sp.]|nr:rhomboid family intramembrane serine protease [Acetatifactor sp.]